MANKFKLISKFKPTGDQPEAIRKLTEEINKDKKYQTLLGVTGSGKTFTLAGVIEKVNLPTIVISHNKTLASQLYAEFKQFFPNNAVEYFVSYYDYYQPESYIPQTDTYIEKDASINEKLDRLRLSATSSLLSRQDVLIVASVSCIYNLGSPQDYQDLVFYVKEKDTIVFEDFLRRLVDMQYLRNDIDFKRGTFRIKGDIVDIFPAYKEQGIRIEFCGESIENIYEFDPITGKKISTLSQIAIYPAKHFIMVSDKIQRATLAIKEELDKQLEFLKKQNKLLESERLKQRTLFDIEMLNECGYCHGIENYSRHLSGRNAGARPYCLLDYFPKPFLTVIDESHVTIPQLRGMYKGDKSRKETLIQYGFRLPSCLDNRPLKFSEFMNSVGKIIFASATPDDFEISLAKGVVVEQITRPTGIPEPEIIIKPTKNQIDDLIFEIKKRADKKERTLVTTLTKRMAEQLTDYLKEEGLRVTYLHSEIDTLERTKILKDLRQSKFDTLIGINLLREGIDLPEVSLVAILDADKEGFLRSSTSLIQISGRCARNINGTVFMYADNITKSMKSAIAETKRRRLMQLEYNRKHKINPKSVKKAISDSIEIYLKEEKDLNMRLDFEDEEIELRQTILQLETEMYLAAKNLHFERAASLRDKINELKKIVKDR
ncbi:MAG: excinuclease ABC subunit UvrB [Candidatus Omnitrophica bacterium]|jgi:excinuclease ABC subunit B|nr:excinuclease ABC subunit UvrB [Candidatus Omnitrophota bacterium]